MLKISEKKLARREKFRKLGKAISEIKVVKLGDPDVPDYYTGRQSSFYRTNGPSSDVNKIHGIGPTFDTPQWIRTVPK